MQSCEHVAIGCSFRLNDDGNAPAWVGAFSLGLIEVTAEHHLIVKEAKLRSYLEGIS